MQTNTGITRVPTNDERLDFILSDEALAFLAALHRQFHEKQAKLLKRRVKRQKELDKGKFPSFGDGALWAHEPDWQVAPCPDDLECRTVEITGPVDAKTIINALNCAPGADVFMADFEDSSSPSWSNMLNGQANLYQAVRHTLSYTDERGKSYRLNDNLATLIVRPRGLHLLEKHLLVDGAPIPASLFDFGLFFFHNAGELREKGSGPYFYLPKMESHKEARYWNNVFNFAQDYLNLPRGTIRATVLIETIMAAYEMEEILFELREHAAGLNAGRWDYIFSFIKRFRAHGEKVLPDRSQVTMDVDFMKAYCLRLVEVCHRRGAHAMGGMSAFIPNKEKPEITAQALAKVQKDKAREVSQGFDGTWVAHPGLIEVAKLEFVGGLAGKPHQKERLAMTDGNCGCQSKGKRKAMETLSASLISVETLPRAVSEEGVRNNISVALQYIANWLSGRGAVAINNLMEDAATAEISRAQLWQWLRHKADLTDGRRFTRALYKQFLQEELQALLSDARGEWPKFYEQARTVLDQVVLSKEFQEFLTLPAYEVLLQNEVDNNAAEDSLSGAISTHKTEITMNEEKQSTQSIQPTEVQPEVSQNVATEGENLQAQPQSDAASFFGTVHAPTCCHSAASGEGETQTTAAPAQIISPAMELDAQWSVLDRWQGIERPFSAGDVIRLRPSINSDCALARHGAAKLWQLLNSPEHVIALGALNGSQAVQMVKAGLKAIYLSGWQVAADANQAGHTYPDQSLYPSNSAPMLVKRLNNAMTRLDQTLKLEGKGGDENYLPIVADAEAGFGGPLQAYELMKMMIEAGAAGVHFEDQLAAEKKCGHMGGKVLVPTAQFVRTLAAARLAADVLDVPTILVARTDALDATLLTSDIDPRDQAFITGERTPEGFFRVRGGMESVIARGLAYAPYADVLWFESSRPDLAEAKRFADAIHAQFPGKILAYNCSPSFNWQKHLDDATIAKFNSELGKMGYKFQFITLAGWHSVNLGMFKLASEYAEEGMPAYVRLQKEEFELAEVGYTAVKHQAEVGAGWFDNLLMSITSGASSTAALSGSTEEDQFHGKH